MAQPEKGAGEGDQLETDLCLGRSVEFQSFFVLGSYRVILGLSYKSHSYGVSEVVLGF